MKTKERVLSRESSAMRRAAERVAAIKADVARPGETDAAPEDMAAEQQRLFLAFRAALLRAQTTDYPGRWREADEAWAAFHRAYLPGQSVVPLRTPAEPGMLSQARGGWAR